MEIIGHCVSAELSGKHFPDDIYGPKITELMLLNFAHCHDWAYRECWSISPGESFYDTKRLLQAHMIGDWIIHYGSKRTNIKRQEGWAFKRMGIITKIARGFFESAKLRGFLLPNNIPIMRWDGKKKLDFYHSIVEYSLDVYLAPRYVTEDRFAAIKGRLSSLTQVTGTGGKLWALDICEKLGVKSDRPVDVIRNSIYELGLDAQESASPTDFVSFTTIRKYGLTRNRATVDFVTEMYNEVAASFTVAEVNELLDEIASAIAVPETIYTGSWNGETHHASI